MGLVKGVGLVETRNKFSVFYDLHDPLKMVLTSWSSWVVEVDLRYIYISYCENCASGCSVVHKTPHHGWHTRWCYVNNWVWGCGGGPITFCCLGFFQHALDATHWSNLQHALGAMILSHDTLLMLRSFLSQVTSNAFLMLQHAYLSQVTSNTLLMLRSFLGAGRLG